ncbi:hypothetical protein B0H14DRAFT_2590418 [Mycena olivaceomarginata]|nr:hypothetical protein B0H14DRAFT_2590418 [Mycena olivaceomarginata]
MGPEAHDTDILELEVIVNTHDDLLAPEGKVSEYRIYKGLNPDSFTQPEKYQSAYGNKLALLERRRQAGYESTDLHHSPPSTTVTTFTISATPTKNWQKKKIPAK